MLLLHIVVLIFGASNGGEAASVLSPLLGAPYVAPTSTAASAAGTIGGETLYVDCKDGSDAHSGASRTSALKTLPKAVSRRPGVIEVSGGVCPLAKPLLIDQPVVIRGDGKTALSGGQAVTGWQPSPRHPGGKVMVTDVSSFPLKEIKLLRLGTTSLLRSRWPKLVGDGLTTPNFMFAMEWSSGISGPNRSYTHHKLGIDPTKLPPHADLSSIGGSGFVHILGCVEKDVNSQMTRVLSTGGTATHPTATIRFRGTFATKQRYYFENVDWNLQEGEFYHDEQAGKLYAWPPATQAAALKAEGAIAPRTDQLLEIRGHDTVISNLTFLDTTYYADGYWDGPGQQPSDAAVRVNFATGVSVEACSFLSVGGYGVGVGNKTTNSSVVGCLFSHTGQGGVFLYGYDANPTSRANGAVPGNDTKPEYIEVAHNVVTNVGQVLVHVAGIGLRSASHCHIHHNRIAGSPRYGLQADSFFIGEGGGEPDNSRFNLLEFNVISDTCRTTSDCGAVEMIGSGDPGLDGSPPGWYTANILRWNNISDTVGSSSSDGKTVCVHGQPAGPTCRGLVWGVYLDGGQSGVTNYGNIIGATLHGAIFDNAGGNNTHMNNIFLGDAESPILMDFGAPGSSKVHPEQTANRSIAGSIVQRNIFYFRNANAKMMSAQTGAFTAELKPNGSDSNLYWSEVTDPTTAKMFPGNQNLSAWQGKTESVSKVVTCADEKGSAGDLIISKDCSETWKHNSTDLKLRSETFAGLVINMDCDGNYEHCRAGDASTRICLSESNGWEPHWPPPRVENQGWKLNADGTITAEVSGKCIESCYRGGAVGGCDGNAGSILQLGTCLSPPSKYQLWTLTESGTLQQKGESGLCVAVPPRATSDHMDLHSIIADPLFVDPAAGDFSLKPSSPAFGLGFEQIPLIHAPTSRCGEDDCLAAFFNDAIVVGNTAPQWSARQRSSSQWYRATDLTVRQSGPWDGFARLPPEAQFAVRPGVWEQAQSSAGVVVYFQQVGSDCTEVSINASLTSAALDMPHMPATGVSGFDLYAFDEKVAKSYRWAAGWVMAWGQQAGAVGSFAGLDSSLSHFALYLPLYNGVSELYLGAAPGCSLVPESVPSEGRVLVYGTSVTQGGVVSRPGAAWTNILSRSLGREVYNFGFSGNGEMELNVTHFLLRVDNVSAIVIDCNQNMHGVVECGGAACTGAAAIAYRAPRLVHYIRTHGHPTTPIVMAGGVPYGLDWVGGRTQHSDYSEALANAVLQMRSDGDQHVTMVAGEDFYAGDPYALDTDTPSVGGCHPSDLGHLRMAKHWHTVLEPIVIRGRPLPEPPHVPPPSTNRSNSTELSRTTHAATIWTHGYKLGLTGLAQFPADFPRKSPYDRFPAALEPTVETEVWQMSRWSSGEFLLFESDSRRLSLNMTLQIPYKHMESLMPETGHSGCDLYTWDEGTDTWLWVANTLPLFFAAGSKDGNTVLAGELFSDGGDHNGSFWRPNIIPAEFFTQPRHYLLYLPLYNGPTQLSIGVNEGSLLRKDEWSSARFCEAAPIVWFGTSIAEGGAAQRPGAQYLNMLTRSLKRVVINAAFAGPGQEQVNITEMIAQMKGQPCGNESIGQSPAAIVFDCLPDLRGAANHAILSSRLKVDIAFLRANGHATTPVVLVEGTDYTDAWAMPSVAAESRTRRLLLQATFHELIGRGEQHLYYVNSSQLWGVDAQEVARASPTVLGTHPNDLGEERLAHSWHAYFSKLLPTLK